jgi:hypothetical protein
MHQVRPEEARHCGTAFKSLAHTSLQAGLRADETRAREQPVKHLTCGVFVAHRDENVLENRVQENGKRHSNPLHAVEMPHGKAVTFLAVLLLPRTCPRHVLQGCDAHERCARAVRPRRDGDGWVLLHDGLLPIQCAKQERPMQKFLLSKET